MSASVKNNLICISETVRGKMSLRIITKPGTRIHFGLVQIQTVLFGFLQLILEEETKYENLIKTSDFKYDQNATKTTE